jgi:hypothetical protein
VLLISLDKSRRAEIESERHTAHASPNALHVALRERMGRLPVSFANTLHGMCSLTCLIGIDQKLGILMLFTAALYVRRAYNKYARHYFRSTSMTMEGCKCMRKIQVN